MEGRIRIRDDKVLAAHRFPLREVVFDYCRKDGRWQTQRYEVYGCRDAKTIILLQHLKLYGLPGVVPSPRGVKSTGSGR